MDAKIGKKDKGPFKYHNVYAGRKRGIFTTWGQCKQSIHKYSNCAFKGFNDIHLAIRHMELNGIKNPILYGDCPSGVDCMKINDDTYVLCSQSTDAIETRDDAHRALLSQKSTDNDFNLPQSMKSLSDTNLPIISTSSYCSNINDEFNLKVNERCEILNGSGIGTCITNCEMTKAEEEDDETKLKTVFDASTDSNLDLDDFSFEDEITLTLTQPKSEAQVQNITLQSIQSANLTKSSTIHKDNVCKIDNVPEVGLKNVDCSCTCKKDLQELKSILLDIQREQKAVFKETEYKILELQTENTKIKKCLETFDEYKEGETTTELLKMQNKMIQDIVNENQEKTLDAMKTISVQSQQMNDRVLEKMDALQSTCNLMPKTNLPSNQSTSKNTNSVNSRKQGIETASPRSNTTHEIDISRQDVHRLNLESNTNKNIGQSHATYAKALSSSSLSLRPKTTYSQSSLSSSISDDDIGIGDFVKAEFFNSKKAPNNELNNSFDENYAQKNSIKLNPKCRNLLIGDSNMKNVVRRRLDNTGKTEVRTYRGATIKTLTDIIGKSTMKYPQVEKITFCVGTNDCSRGLIDEFKIIHDYEQLLVKTRNIFPTAEISVLAIPPMANTKVNQALININKHLRNLVKRKNALFMACNSLWYHVGKDGYVDNGVLTDSVHLSTWGLGLLLQNVIPFFYHQQPGSLANGNDNNKSQMLPPQRKIFPFNENQCESQNQIVDKVANELASSLYKVFEYFK